MNRRRIRSLFAVSLLACSPALTAIAVAEPLAPPQAVTAAPKPPVEKPGPSVKTGEPVAPPAAEPALNDGFDKVLPEVKFEAVPLDDVVAFLQDVSGGKFRAVVVHRGDADGPAITMRLKNVSIGQVMNVITTAYSGIEITSVDGPTGPVHVIALGPAGNPAGLPEGDAAAEPERAVRVYRLAGIVDTMTRPGVAFSGPAARDSKEAKEAMNNILSLIKATVQLTNPREGPTLQVHEETQTLIFKGSSAQRQAIEDVLASLESNKAVRPEKASWPNGFQLNDMKAELERTKAELERTRKDADVVREQAAKRAEVAEREVQDMNARLRDREIAMARMEAKMAEAGSARDERNRGQDERQAAALQTLTAELRSVRDELAEAQLKYAADHPEVQKLKAKAEQLERMLAQEHEKASRPATPGR